MNNFEQYPQRIVNPLLALDATSDLAAEHKLLLDLGETLLTHITGIIFGEYKRHWKIDEKLEAEFYRNAKRKPSFGIFLNLLRKLIKAEGQSVFDEFFEKGKAYTAISDFVFNYELLKNSVVNQGYDNGFEPVLEPLRKGRTVARKNALQFFDAFIAVRNTFAHPEEKAKNPLRSWPLGEEYYLIINPLLRAALIELISAMHVLSSHRPVLVKDLDDLHGKGVFVEEVGSKGRALQLDLTAEDLDFLNTDVRYVLDHNNRFAGKFYQSEIPQVNQKVAQQVVEQEKARMMEPVLLEIIGQKLDDGVIDELEYLVLKDTAFTSFISEDRLRDLIEKVKSSKGIEGDVYVESKDSSFRPMLNPHWLAHFAMLHDSTVEQSDNCLDPSNLHRNLWRQISNYIEYLVHNHLDNEFVQWKIKPNKYQIGRLSFTYWGQIYPTHSPFQNGFSIGFIVAKKFSWVKAKKHNPLREKLEQPCILLYTTLNNKFMDDVDYDGTLQKEYARINFELLLREREILERLGGFTNALSYRTGDIHTLEDYFKEKSDCEDDENLWIYSKIWNGKDFLVNDSFDPDRTCKIEKEILTYLALFSNSVLTVNEFAETHGFNAEQVRALQDKVTRNQKILMLELQEKLVNEDLNIHEYALSRGEELKLRKDRVLGLLRKLGIKK